jgi:beta-phosphoglucomutase-like phosphatase (HAD superfamily)
MIGAASGFSAIVTGNMVQRGKPAPDIYLAAARQLSIPPEACLALEDAPHGVQAAKAAGMICVAVPNRFTLDLDLGAADRMLPSLSAVVIELETLIQL